MKNILLICLVFIISEAQSQSIEDAPKKTSKIIIKNNLTADDNYKIIGQTLLDNGYSIGLKDKEFYVMESGWAEVKNIGASYLILSFRIKDGTIELSGYLFCSMNGLNPSGRPKDIGEIINNRGMKRSPLLLSFQQMFDFALLLPHNSFSYITL